MKRKQVVKMLSIGMAGILAISSCNMAGGMVYAEEVSQENVVEGENTEETFTESAAAEEEQENEEVEEATVQTKETTVEKETEETTESTTEEAAGEDEASQEETTQEATEEVTEEVTEEEMTELTEEEPVAMAADVEETQLQQFYGQELAFDDTSSWDDKGENQLGLSTDTALNSGTKVSFDLYIPAENAEYEGLIKVQGIARLGSGWSWTQNDVIPELGSGDFTRKVERSMVNYIEKHMCHLPLVMK